MTKCSVASTRKRRNGSNRVAPAADAAAASTSAAAAATVRVTARRLSRLGGRGLRVTRGTSEEDAQDERRDAEQAGADEKQRVRVEQRSSGGEPLDPHTRKPLREFTDVGVRRAEQRVLRRRVAEARQARHVGDSATPAKPIPKLSAAMTAPKTRTSGPA